MSDEYTLREVHVEIQPGVTLIADVRSMDALSGLLADLNGKGIAPTTGKPTRSEEKAEKNVTPAGDTPGSRIEVNAGIPEGSLTKKNIVAFKDDVPQLLRPSAFGAITEAALVLLHSVETGLRNQEVDYDSFKGLFEQQNVKSGTPLSMLMTNLRNSGYIDKNAYKNGRRLRLTAKGDKQAIEILKRLAEGE